MTAFNPFFINSNICLKQEDICDFDTFMKTIAGNTGNSYITYSLMKELGVDAGQTKHISSIYTYDFNNLSKDAEIIRENCSHLFLILQDQIRISESYGLQLPYKGIEQLIEKSQKPLVIMGLGANSFTGFDPEFYKQLKPDLVAFLKFLSDHTPEIGVRGNFTAEVLNQLGIKNVRVIGCPSFYEMGLGRVVNKVSDIEIKDILLTHSCPILSLQNNHQICQDFQEENIIKTIAFNEKFKVKKTDEINKILQHKYHVFSSIEDWKKCISNFKFAFGDRLHGSICALNAGVPAICTNKDSRAREMCEFLHIPYYPHVDENTDVLSLYEQADIDDLNKNYPMLFDNFKDFIVKNVGITPFKEKAQIRQPSLRLYAERNKTEMIKEKLQIMLITYNRVQKLKNTLDCLLDSKSPIKDFDITILDNASTDGTSDLLDEYTQKYPNLKHIRHERNIGGNANITRAFEIAQKEYLWVLCDDDSYNWIHWKAIEQAIFIDKYDMIFTNRYLNIKSDVVSKGYLAFLASFLPGVIYKTKFITDDILQNMYGMIHTWFPQSILSLDILFNKKGNYWLPNENLIIRGNIPDPKENIASLTRGIHLLHPDLQRMFWHVGFIKVAQIITDSKIRSDVIETTNFNERWNENFIAYCQSIFDYNTHFKKSSKKNLNDVYLNLSRHEKNCFLIAKYSSYFKQPLYKYFPIYIRFTPKGIILHLFYKIKIRIWSRKWLGLK